jgi:outer membrane lipoprotein SlyB
VPIETDPIERRGDEGSRAGDAVAIGSTAALGTALGAIVGGGRGALIGAAAGGAVGAAGTLGSTGKETAVKSEAVLMFRMRAPASVKVLEEKEAKP